MTKLTLLEIGSGVGSSSLIDANSDRIEVALENTLSLDGTLPNAMNAQLDMDSNRIINVPSPLENTDGVNKLYVDSLLSGTTDTGSAQLRANLADATDADNGDALVAGKRTDLTGAIAFTIHQYNATRPANLKLDFGAQGDGIANDTAAMIAAANSGSLMIFVPAGTYLWATGTTIPVANGQSWFGESKRNCVFLKGANGDMFTLATKNSFEHIWLKGDGANYTGRGFVVGAGVEHSIEEVDVTDMESYCMEFTVDGAASQSNFRGIRMTRTNLANAAIKFPTDTAAAPRKFYGVESDGGVLFDMNGARDTFIIGGYIGNITFNDNTMLALFSNVRVATNGSSLTIKGTSVRFDSSCSSANSVILDANSTGCEFEGGYSSSITDNSGLNTNRFNTVLTSFTSVWTGASVNPAIGDGALICRYERKGGKVTVWWDLTIGASTTLGTGEWRFSLPFTASPVLVQNAGVARLVDASTGDKDIASVQVGAGGTFVTLQTPGAAITTVKETVPWAWQVSDTLRFFLEYHV